MNKLLLSALLGLVVTPVVAAKCPDTHFNFSVQQARLAMARDTAPRFTYIPENLKPEADSVQCRMVTEALTSAADRDDEMGFAGKDRHRLIGLVKCIDQQLGRQQLPLLEVAYVGDPRDAQTARQIIEGWGAKFHFRSDQSYLQEQGDEVMLAQCAAGQPGS